MINRELLKYPEQFVAYLRQLENRIAALERENRKLRSK